MCTDRQEIMLRRQGYYECLMDRCLLTAEECRELAKKAFPLTKKIVPNRILDENGSSYWLDADGLIKYQRKGAYTTHLFMNEDQVAIVKRIFAQPTIEVEDDDG